MPKDAEVICLPSILIEILNSQLTLMKHRQLKRKWFQSHHAKIPTLQMFMNFGIYLLSKDSLGEQSNCKCLQNAV